MGTTNCKMNYLLLSCGTTCFLTIGILCHLLQFYDIKCYLMLLSSSPALCYLMLAPVIVWYYMKTKQDQTGPNRTIRDHTGPFVTICDHLWPFRTIRDHTGPYGTKLDQTGAYRTIWDQGCTFYKFMAIFSPNLCVNRDKFTDIFSLYLYVNRDIFG